MPDVFRFFSWLFFAIISIIFHDAFSLFEFSSLFIPIRRCDIAHATPATPTPIFVHAVVIIFTPAPGYVAAAL